MSCSRDELNGQFIPHINVKKMVTWVRWMLTRWSQSQEKLHSYFVWFTWIFGSPNQPLGPKAHGIWKRKDFLVIALLLIFVN